MEHKCLYTDVNCPYDAKDNLEGCLPCEIGECAYLLKALDCIADLQLG